MTEKNKNLLLRMATALVGLPIVVILLIKGGYYSGALMAFAAGACAGEYYLITQKSISPIGWLGVLLAAVLPLYPVYNFTHGTAYSFWTVAVFFFAAWGYFLMKGPLAQAPALASHLLMGLLYGGIGFHAASALRMSPHGLEWVVCTLVITWGNDTVAYFAGRFLGRHKLYPEVSPNKTWEGFAGGMLGSVGGMFLARATFFPDLTVIDCLAIGVLGGILGPLGDLCESMLKRAYGAKDSGTIIPGHGGMLDRVDALVFNAPMVFVYVHLWR